MSFFIDLVKILLMRILFLLFFLPICLLGQAQTPSVSTQNAGVKRPKLVVGIMVDQMRWDYLYRLNSRYFADGGFKRLLNQGFTCENAFIPYTPSITACGHTFVYTGSVPAIRFEFENCQAQRKEIELNSLKRVYKAEK